MTAAMALIGQSELKELVHSAGCPVTEEFDFVCQDYIDSVYCVPRDEKHLTPAGVYSCILSALYPICKLQVSESLESVIMIGTGIMMIACLNYLGVIIMLLG